MPSYLSNTPTARPSGRRTFVAASAAIAGAALVLTGVVTSPAGAATATPTAVSKAPSKIQQARWGAGYLARQITATQPYLAPFGAPDLGNTAYAVVGLHAAGVGGNASKLALGWLKTQVADGMAGSDGTDDPGRLGFTVLAAVASGQDPRHFGGSAPANNLVQRLLATSRGSGSDAGLFGTADPTFDGAFRQGVALAALKAAGVAKSAVRPNIAWLVAQQCANGLWTSYRASTTTVCPVADPNTFMGPETNSSSLAVQGLAAYGSFPQKSLVLKAFKQVQSDDGGFPFLALAGQASDPNSTALSVQALLADGAKPALPGYQVDGQTPYAALAAYQLGCSDPKADRGAFFFPGSRAANVLATVQAVPALAQATVPIGASTPRPGVPTVPCPSPSPSTPTALLSTTNTAAALAGTAGHCPSTTKGVTVAVDFTAFGGRVQVRCAPGTPATGVAALQQAGFTPAGTTRYGLAFICRINNLPSTAQQACATTPSATAYWAYYHANKGATTWTYSTAGASTYKPAQGSIEAWAFGNGAKPRKTPAQVRKATS